MQTSGEGTTPLPGHFHKENFAIAVIDNFDHEDRSTISGTHASHDTVSDLFQVSGIGTSGDKQTMFYVEVTDQMKKGPGGGNPKEGELIEVVEMSISEATSYMAQHEVQSPGVTCETSLHVKQVRLSLSGDESSSQQALPGDSIATGVKGERSVEGPHLPLLGPALCDAVRNL
uniref:Uncharacterized protein n=1 Tax=Timema bartmani TaxID=61472 RepID=A0A7R9F630_9NEOP|nr:unnamed protein product [Timema bartmani]